MICNLCRINTYCHSLGPLFVCEGCRQLALTAEKSMKKEKIIIPLSKKAFDEKTFTIVSPTLNGDIIFIASVKNLILSKLVIQSKYSKNFNPTLGTIEIFETDKENPDISVDYLINELNDLTFTDYSEKFEFEFYLQKSTE